MLNETGSNYRLNEIGSVSSVRTNAGSSNNALSALGYRLESFTKSTKIVKIRWYWL
jgi:hypothetical protein